MIIDNMKHIVAHRPNTTDIVYIGNDWVAEDVYFTNWVDDINDAFVFDSEVAIKWNVAFFEDELAYDIIYVGMSDVIDQLVMI